MTNLYNFDKELLKNKKLIAGIDEVGRGPLAGPVCVAIVVLDKSFYHKDINDSKKLTDKKRKELYDYIIDNCIEYKILLYDNLKIDEIGIQTAILELMHNSYNLLINKPDILVVDYLKLNIINSFSYKKADQLSQAVACASILAKVTRDNLMIEYSKKYPGYFFEKHKGYGTKVHYQKIKELGVSPIHRLTYNLHTKE